MKRLGIVASVAVFLTAHFAEADALKQSLNGLLHQKETTPAMVNIDALGMKAKTFERSRSPKAVVAIADGMKIRKRTLDGFLRRRTKGKVTDFDRLPPKQKKVLVQEYILPKLFAKHARKEIPRAEREAIFAKAWLAKAAQSSDVPEEEIKRFYEKVRQDAQRRSPLAPFPPYKKLKPVLKAKIVENRIVKQLMQSATVTLDATTDGKIVGHIGTLPVTLSEAEKAVAYATRGKATWQTLPDEEKKRILMMLAPSKLVAEAAENGLSKKEKETALTNVWMQKKLSQITVSDKALKRRYRKLKKLSKKKLPPFDKIANAIKLQLAQEKLAKNITKHVKIILK